MISNPPLVSVLMPVYNGAEFLSESIESILTQSYKNFTLVIVNDGSTDNTEEIIYSYQKRDGRIECINQRNKGIVDALNNGLSYCTGELIARADADDICISNRLEMQVQYLSSNLNVGIVGSWVKLFGRKNEIWHHRKYDNFIRNMMFFKTCGFSHSSVMVRNQVFLDFKYRNDYLYAEDMDLFLRVALESSWKFSNICEVLVEYRVHNSQVSEEFKQKQDESFFKLILKYILYFLPNVSASELEIHNRICMLVLCENKKELEESGAWLEKLALAVKKKQGDFYYVFQEKWWNYSQLHIDFLDRKQTYNSYFTYSEFCCI